MIASLTQTRRQPLVEMTVVPIFSPLKQKKHSFSPNWKYFGSHALIAICLTIAIRIRLLKVQLVLQKCYAVIQRYENKNVVCRDASAKDATNENET